MTKSTKSHIRERSPLLYISSRVHELVARAMRGECVREMVGQKSAVLPLPTVSSIPRVRTQRTRKPSRFVHALSARPLKVQGGRDSNMYADGTKSYFLFCLFAVLRLYLVGVGAVDDPRGRVEHCSPAKKYKETFPFGTFLH